MDFSKIIILVFISIIMSTTSVNGTMAQVDCRDNSLSESCICGLDQESDFLLMECQNPLSGSSSKLPDIPSRTVMSSNSLMQWPAIPASYKKKVIALILSENRISSIGDLKNLENLKLLNLSFNAIKKIDSSISKLNELIMLDISGNLLEEIHFGDFVPNLNKSSLGKDDQIFSKLQFLFVYGNQIKFIYDMDLMFIGMPFINALFLDNNKIKSIDVDLSQHSLNIISKTKKALTQNKTYLKILSTPSQYGFYIGFNYNYITHVKFNFKSTLNEIFMPYKKLFLTKYIAISLNAQSAKTICDCDLYKDTAFLVENLLETFKNEEVPDGDFLNLQCFIGNSQTPVKMFDVVNQNIVSKSEFCPNNTETTTKSKPRETTKASKKTDFSTKESKKNVTSTSKGTTSMSKNSETKTNRSYTSPYMTTLLTSKKN